MNPNPNPNPKPDFKPCTLIPNVSLTLTITLFLTLSLNIISTLTLIQTPRPIHFSIDQLSSVYQPIHASNPIHDRSIQSSIYPPIDLPIHPSAILSIAWSFHSVLNLSNNLCTIHPFNLIFIAQFSTTYIH